MSRRRGSKNWRKKLEPIVKAEVLSPEDEAELASARSTADEDEETMVSRGADVLRVDDEDRHEQTLKGRRSSRAVIEDPGLSCRGVQSGFVPLEVGSSRAQSVLEIVSARETADDEEEVESPVVVSEHVAIDDDLSGGRDFDFSTADGVPIVY